VKLDAVEVELSDLTVVDADPAGVPVGTFTQISVWLHAEDPWHSPPAALAPEEEASYVTFPPPAAANVFPCPSAESVVGSPFQFCARTWKP